MSTDSTRWTIIQRAAAGSAPDRAEFARRYGPVIRQYLSARWRSRSLEGDIDDAMQDVFVQCFREGGALGRADPDGPAGFRGYLYGVVRNVALKAERTRARRREIQPDSAADLDRVAADEDSLAAVFDRAWANAVFQDAARLHREQAAAKGSDAVRRYELLALRYGEDLPIREIAARWNSDPAWLHGQFRQAREEFKRALADTVRELQGGGPERIEAECVRLLRHLS